MKKINLRSVLKTALVCFSGISMAQEIASIKNLNTFYLHSENLVSKLGAEPGISFPVVVPEIIKPEMTAKKLDSGINSSYSEIGPLLSHDGKTLYFSRYLDPSNMGGKEDEEDIWYAEWDETINNWGAAKNMGSPLNNKYPNYINSISHDGNSIIVGNTYLPNGNMDHGVSISYKTPDGTWSIPEKLIIEDNSSQDWAGVYLSNDQKILLMSHKQRKNSFGELDIYVSFVKEDKSWSKPINLGNMINTKGMESAPFLSADGTTLYFTSDGLGGYGGSDIFMSKRLDDSWNNWSSPMNMGPKVNTKNDESFFSISNDGNKIFFTSENEMPGNHDIYMLNTPTTITAPTVAETTPALKEETNVTAGNVEVYKINPVLFDFDKALLKDDAKNNLDKLVTYLNDHKEAYVEISAFTDNIGSFVYNINLCRKRAKAVTTYLKDKISNNQFSYNYLGEADAVGDNNTAEGRKLNRRVEFKVTAQPLLGMN